jgi:tetratricopeptide (TPR) repeat protein
MSSIASNSNNTWQFLHEAETLRLMGHYGEAIQCFKQALAQNSQNPWALAHQAEAYFQIRSYPQAIDLFNRAIDLSPNYA